VIDDIGAKVPIPGNSSLRFDFDEPNANNKSNNPLGESGLGNSEVMTAGGDSGAPYFFDEEIIGIHSGATETGIDSKQNNSFGEIGNGANLSVNSGFVKNVIGNGPPQKEEEDIQEQRANNDITIDYAPFENGDDPYKPNTHHGGIDLNAKPGDVVQAIQGGEVFANTTEYLTIKTANDLYWVYGNVDPSKAPNGGLSVGDTVGRGDQIGTIASGSEWLHFEVQPNPVDENSGTPYAWRDAPTQQAVLENTFNPVAELQPGNQEYDSIPGDDPGTTDPIEDGQIKLDLDEDGSIENINDILLPPDGAATSEVGTASLSAPTYTQNGQADYEITLSASSRFNQFNFAFIADESGSMTGSKIENTKQAFQNLLDSLEDQGIASNSQFGVIPFESTAELIGPSSAQDARNAIQNLNAGGGTNYKDALTKAIEFYELPQTNTGTNIAYFLSDGEPGNDDFSNEAAGLQNLAEVRAFGIGSGPDNEDLNQIDSNNSFVELNDPSNLTAEFQQSSFNADDIEKVEILRDGTVIDTLDSSDFQDTAVGLTASGSLDGLDVTPEGNEITAKVSFNNNFQSTSVTRQITGGQENVIQTSGKNNDTISLNASAQYQGPVSRDIQQLINEAGETFGGPGNDEIIGNNLNNLLIGGSGNNTLIGAAGDDLLIPGSDGDNQVDGGPGKDVVRFDDLLANVGPITRVGEVVTIGSNTTNATNVEVVQTKDTRIEVSKIPENQQISSPSDVPSDAKTPLLEIANPSISVEEGDSGQQQVQFDFELSNPIDQDITLDYQTSSLSQVAGFDEPATAGEDYESSSGQITITSGQTQATVNVDIFGDTEFEANEVFSVEFSNLSGASFEDDQQSAVASGTIVNDDSAIIRGTSQPDTLTGTPGNDKIIGLGAGDTMTGNGGKDRFVYENLDNLRSFPGFEDAFRDTITDFEPGSDVIDFSQAIENTFFPPFTSNTPFQDYIKLFASNSDTKLKFDLNGDFLDNFQEIATLKNVSPEDLSAEDFVFKVSAIHWQRRS